MSLEKEKGAKVLLQALPYIKKFYNKIVVVKYGGAAMENPQLLPLVIKDIVLMKMCGIKVVVVHGGGKAINLILEKVNKKSEFIDGLRVTDEETISLVQMVLAGKVNKDLVDLFQLEDIDAVGICGHDAKTFITKKHSPKGIDLGYVGEIQKVNTKLIETLLKNDFLPVIATVGTDDKGNSYNINADFAASEVAKALGAEKLIYLSDIEGVYKKDSKEIYSVIKTNEVEGLIKDEVIKGGMIPKLNCCKDAVENGVKCVHIIDGRKENSLLVEIFTDLGIGTIVEE